VQHLNPSSPWPAPAGSLDGMHGSAAQLEEERRVVGLRRAEILAGDARCSLAGVCAILDPDDPRQGPVVGAAFLLETVVGQLQTLQGQASASPDGA
jgi:hypothetical protein